jgi:hypothetical protein
LKIIFFLIFKAKYTYVHYCKGVDFKTKIANCEIVKGTEALMNNGITIDRNNNIWVAKTYDRKVVKYSIDDENRNVLHSIKEIDLGYAPDNIKYDENTNSIYSGVIGKLLNHKEYVEKRVGGADVTDFSFWGGAVKIDVNNNEVSTMVMQDKKLFGVSTSYQIGNKVLMGSWFDDGILICRID